jgi:hypothetical protein
MPWLVVIFGILIVPLGIVSITFIIIQPIIIGTWCTLCLVAAAAMLIQIPYSVDELLATGQFLYRRHQAGKPFLRVLLFGDIDQGDVHERESFEQPPLRILSEMVAGGISLPWNLLLVILVGVYLMFTRLSVGAEGVPANADHLIGALVVTVAVTALAEVARTVRLLCVPLGFALLITPFVLGADWPATLSSLICGLLVVGLSLPRGPIWNRYGDWSRTIF